MPDNLVMPEEKDFADNKAYEQAQSEFEAKQTRWNALQGLLKKGFARSNHEPCKTRIIASKHLCI